MTKIKTKKRIPCPICMEALSLQTSVVISLLKHTPKVRTQNMVMAYKNAT